MTESPEQRAQSFADWATTNRLGINEMTGSPDNMLVWLEIGASGRYCVARFNCISDEVALIDNGRQAGVHTLDDRARARVIEFMGIPAKRPHIRDLVKAFHRTYDVPIAKTPALLSGPRQALRLDLIREEFDELIEACNWGDIVAIADALADLAYVVEGMNLELGINSEPILAEVHRSNMSKLGSDGQPIRREDGKVLKGPNYSPPDVAGELRKQGWRL